MSRISTTPPIAVQSSATIGATASQVWSVLRDFCATWHPAIHTMNAEYDAAGHLIRAFTVHGEETVYRERLTWFSDSEQSMAYTHVEGIDGVDSYDAWLHVTGDEKDRTRCSVTLSATVVADEPRATGIAAGTGAIFDDGLEAIQSLFDSAADQSHSQSNDQRDLPAVSAGSALPTQRPTQQTAQQSTQDIREHTINGAARLTLSVIDGPPDCRDTLCLFLHGIGGNRSNWNAQLTATAPYCTAASLDLRGYGDSTLGATQSTIDDYCADILRVVDSFNAKKLVLCGLSYGAWIATSFTVRHPERLAGLVLSGGCTGMSEASAAERESFQSSREVPLSQGQTPADFAPAVLNVIGGPKITETAKNELLMSMRAIPSATYADALRCFTNPTETFDFVQLDMPVLLMTGDADRLAPPSEIKQVATRIHQASANADVRYECLSNSGHVCNLEAPDAYNTALVELLQRVL